jgi:acyl-CoA synthetase (AMP-forming)/AMP-acid ligase II
VDGDGWLHTGDVGVLDPAGNLTITDRLKDLYVSGGFNVYPAEVEAVLLAHPAIARVAVVGVPDARLGEVGCAVVVPVASQSGAGGATGVACGLADDVVAWARQRLANFKVPRRVVFVDELPVNAGGKVLKRELRDRYGGPATVGKGAAPVPGDGRPTRRRDL